LLGSTPGPLRPQLRHRCDDLPEGVVTTDPKEWDSAPAGAYEEWGIALRSRSPTSPGFAVPLRLHRGLTRPGLTQAAGVGSIVV